MQKYKSVSSFRDDDNEQKTFDIVNNLCIHFLKYFSFSDIIRKIIVIGDGW